MKQATIFDKPEPPKLGGLAPEDEALLGTAYGEIFKDGKIIWEGRLCDLPDEVVAKIWE